MRTYLPFSSIYLEHQTYTVYRLWFQITWKIVNTTWFWSNSLRFGKHCPALRYSWVGKVRFKASEGGSEPAKILLKNDTFWRGIGILVNWAILTGILKRMGRYPLQSNSCWILSIYQDSPTEWHVQARHCHPGNATQLQTIAETPRTSLEYGAEGFKGELLNDLHSYVGNSPAEHALARHWHPGKLSHFYQVFWRGWLAILAKIPVELCPFTRITKILHVLARHWHPGKLSDFNRYFEEDGSLSSSK